MSPPRSSPAAHARSAQDVLRALESDARAGLATSAVAQRRARFGPNELAHAAPTPAWVRFARQFREVVVLLLLAAALVSLALGERLDAGAILAIVVLNAVLGFAQEERAARAIEALRRMVVPKARVRRDGDEQQVDARELVPGDVVLLEAGDVVPADARLLETVALRSQEAALTGESVPVDKLETVVLDEPTALAERRNMLFMGTIVAAGRATAVVVATGMSTELGQIAGLLGAVKPTTTPLQERLAHTGRVLALAVLAIVVLIALLYAYRGGEWGEVLVVSIGLAVAAVPEGLPAVVTIALALGMRRLVERNALVRRLASAETLGSVSVICTDKTGTLTRNEMTVREVWTPARKFTVSGSGYAADGRIEAEDGGDAARDPDLALAARIGAVCNNAHLTTPDREHPAQGIVGDPTEGALLVLARKADAALELAPGERVAFELPFDSERKRMTVAVTGEAGTELFVKGAVEVVLARCTRRRRGGRVEALDDRARAQVLETANAMALGALRVLALAHRPGPADPEQAESELVFVALVGLQDPPRPEVREAVRTCRAAGIRPVMVTGDHPATALAIAREVGLAGPDENAVTGAELERWSDAELDERLADCPVFARTSALHKLRIVRAWRRRDAVVAMTGDGVNDAPALQEADMGIAMGRNGTDVTREAADMVLVDDNFASIVSAVREGRGIFDNIRKFVLYLLSANAAEIALMAVAALVGWPLPLGALQLLWINLVTDGLPALALAVEPTESDVMQRRPIARHAPVVSARDARAIVARAALLALAAGAVFRTALDDGALYAGSLAFSVMVFGQLAYVFAFRSERRTLFELGPLSNRGLLGAVAATAALQVAVTYFTPLSALLEVVPPSARDWPIVVGASLAPVTTVELLKLVRRRRRGGASEA